MLDDNRKKQIEQEEKLREEIREERERQKKKKESKNAWVGCIIVLVFLIMLGIWAEYSDKDGSNNSQISPTSSVAETEISSHEIVNESIKGTTATITVFTQNKDDKDLITLNDALFNKYGSDKTHLYLYYFDNEEIAKTYFQKQSDENISEGTKDSLFNHFIAQMKYNTTTGLKTLYKNSDGKWVELKSY